MKTFKLLFLSLCLLTVAACGEDDDPVVCGQSDWVGTYAGEAVCDGMTVPATATITASGADNIVFLYVAASTETTYDAQPFDGCNFNVNATGNDLTVTLDATRNGDQLTFTEVTNAAGTTTSCTATLTRN